MPACLARQLAACPASAGLHVLATCATCLGPFLCCGHGLLFSLPSVSSLSPPLPPLQAA